MDLQRVTRLLAPAAPLENVSWNERLQIVHGPAEYMVQY